MLIVGGGVVGLSTALFLAHHGVRVTVAERRAGTARHPGFRGVAARTMELYRSAGIEDDIWAVTGSQQVGGHVARTANLAAADVSWLPTPWQGDQDTLSPCRLCTCDQDRLEPVLREQAERRGAEVRFGTEVVEFGQDDTGVRAVLRHGGERCEVRAAYLVAADGQHGKVRPGVGIARSGPGVLEHRLTILLRTDLEPTVHGRRLTAGIVEDVRGTMVPLTPGRWMMSVPYDPADGVFTEDRCLELFRAGAGRPDVTATVEAVLPWRPSALVADRFRAGRVLLVGDTAHVMPPTGGFGGNSGVHDAHNLAWKLAAVLSGAAGEALLDTYEAERRPVIEHTVNESLIRLRSWFRLPGGDPKRTEPRDDNTVMFGYRYRSAAVVAAVEDGDEDGAGDLFEDPRTPSGRPGTRAPHVRVGLAGRERSTLDLFGGGFVLLSGQDGAGWHDAAAALGLTAYRVGVDVADLDGRWAQAYGVTASGAVLVRPDGFIAWRATSAGDEPAAALGDVLGDVLRTILGAPVPA